MEDENSEREACDASPNVTCYSDSVAKHGNSVTLESDGWSLSLPEHWGNLEQSKAM